MMSYQNFGSHLKAIRQDRKITQLDISRKIGISRQAYSNYEQGLRIPDAKTLASLSVILDTNLFIYFFDSAMSFYKQRTPADVPKSEYSLLLNIYSSMSLSERIHLIDSILPAKDSYKANNNYGDKNA